MQQDELEVYLNAMLPSLRRKLLKREIDNDILQAVLVSLFEHCREVEVNGEDQFRSIVESHFYRRLWALNRDIEADKFKGNYLADHMQTNRGGSLTFHDEPDSHVIEQRSFYDPWESPNAQAFEFIEEVSNPLIKQTMIQFYIQGFTMKELADMEGVSTVAIHKRLKRGVETIKDSLKAV